jgi:hypothetical protein
MSVELFMSYDESLDWLTLIEFGQVENAQPKDHWGGVSDSFGYVLRNPEVLKVPYSPISQSPCPPPVDSFPARIDDF